MRIAGKITRAIPALVFGAAVVVHAEFWVLPEVPGGAQIVEYIATGKDSGAYFDTGIIGANDMTTRVEFAYTTLPTANSGIFGNATTPKRYRIYYISKKRVSVSAWSKSRRRAARSRTVSSRETGRAPTTRAAPP